MAYGRFEIPKELTTITNDQVTEYAAAAESHYRADMTYHNWNHALTVMYGVEVISSKLKQHGIQTAQGALAVAAAWHDAGYHENHRTLGFATKEQYSAHLLNKFLEDKPIGDFDREIMERAILATWHGHETLRTPTELILHRADIANIGGSTDEFLENSVAVWRETVNNEDRRPWATFVEDTAQFVAFTIEEHDREATKHMLSLSDTTIDVADRPFVESARRNLARLLISEPPES